MGHIGKIAIMGHEAPFILFRFAKKQIWAVNWRRSGGNHLLINLVLYSKFQSLKTPLTCMGPYQLF